MTTPRVSVALATYNGARHLARQLDSVLGQTVKPDEIIVCDDCSTDGTMQLLRDYERRHATIHVRQNSRNLGFLGNFGQALGLCSGHFIALCDQDDIWDERHIETLLGIIGDKPMAAGNTMLADDSGRPLGTTLKEQEAFDRVAGDPMDRALTILLFRNPIQGASMLVRREALTRMLPFPEGVNFHDTWIAAAACFMGGFAYTDGIVSLYRRHAGNVTAGNLARRKNRLKEVVCAIAYNRQFDRLAIIDAIAARCGEGLDARQRKRLADMRRIVLRRGTWWGRLMNIPYTLTHLRDIYSF